MVSVVILCVIKLNVIMQTVLALGFVIVAIFQPRLKHN
jgi:hypothetical protein